MVCPSSASKSPGQAILLEFENSLYKGEYATASNVEMAWRLRVDHIVFKPAATDEVRNVVRRLLSIRGTAKNLVLR